MGKRAFSAKAKRAQLRTKRAAAAAANPTSNTPASAPSHHAPLPAQHVTTKLPASSATPAAAPAPQQQQQQQHRRGAARGKAGRNRHADRYKLKFAADSDAARATARAKAFEAVALQGRADDSNGAVHGSSLGVYEVRPRGNECFSGPRRPAWSYDETTEEVEERESKYFEEWLAKVQNDEAEDAAFFEQNLETWRQLWRVVERSDVLLLVVDIRFPGLHFVPDLYDFVTKESGKGMVLAMNKCDLVSEALLDAWKMYFREKFPNLALAMFSSFPDARLAPSEANSELLSKRERRMARSKLAAWGADQLLAAVDTLEFPDEKKKYLQQWRALIPSDKDQVAGPRNDDPRNGPLDHGDLAVSAESAEKERIAQLQDMENISDENGYGRVESEMVTIGVIGHPNAGKSSLINGVFGRKVVSTSSTPGHTKHLQTMFLSSRVRLCDCPGLVFPGRAPRELQVLAGMYPVSQLREPYAVVKYLADRVPVISILDLEAEIPKLEAENDEPFPGLGGWTAWKICEAWAHKRGFRTAKAARLDVFRAANNILRLALDGRLVLATAPPGFEAPQAARDSATGSGSKNTDTRRVTTVLDATFVSPDTSRVVGSVVVDAGSVDSASDEDSPSSGSQSMSSSISSSASEGESEEAEGGMGMFSVLGSAEL